MRIVDGQAPSAPEPGPSRRFGVRRPLRAIVRLLVCALAMVAGLTLPAARTGIGAGGPWNIVYSPNTSPSQDNYLFGVSCVSEVVCTAVGDYYNGSNYQTLIESYNNYVWSIVGGRNTSPTENNELAAVSCAATTACMAVGDSGNYPGLKTLIESWDGSSWSLVSSPSPSATQQNVLKGVSCTDANTCVAVGYYLDAPGVQTLILSWDGSTWSTVTSPNVASSVSDVLTSVSCVSATVCTAAGNYEDSGSSWHALVETLNGGVWGIVPAPSPSSSYNELDGVSCSAANFCMAIGFEYNGTADETLILKWDGISWSLVSSPSPSSNTNLLNAVYCAGPTDCTAVGNDTYDADFDMQTLILSWDGSTWKVVPSPNANGLPGRAPSGSPPVKNDELKGVSLAAAVGEHDQPRETLAIENVPVPIPDLEIKKTHSGSFSQGGSGTYTIIVTNDGNGPTNGPLTVTDTPDQWFTIPAGGMSGTNWSCVGNKCVYNGPPLAPGRSAPPIIVTGAVANDAPATLINGASVVGGGGYQLGALSTKDIANVTGSNPTAGLPQFSIEKTHSSDFTVGQTDATFTITVSNAAGAAPTSDTVAVIDSAPRDFHITGMSAPAGWTCFPAQGDCFSGPSIPPGGTVTIVVTGTVSLAAPNSITNNASVNGGGRSKRQATSDSVNVAGGNPPPTAPTLTIAGEPVGTFTQGAVAQYSLTVGNNAGAGSSSGPITLVAAPNPYLTYTSASGLDWNCVLPICTTSNVLTPGSSSPPITFNVNVAAGAPTGANAITAEYSATGGGGRGPVTFGIRTDIAGSQTRRTGP